MEDKINCDSCDEEIKGFYEDNHDGSYTCLSCLVKIGDGDIIDNEF